MDSLESARRSCRQSRLERLRAEIHKILKAVNKPLGDIIRDNALQHLPPRSLLRFQSVSTSWRCLIATPLFSHTQSYTYRSITGIFHPRISQGPAYTPFSPAAAHAIPDPDLAFLPCSDSITVQASSHGLICCRSLLRSYYIVNPATEEWTALPEPPSYVSESDAVVLAFEPSVHDLGASYHLIYAHAVRGDCEGLYGFHVFSSQTGEWTSASDVCAAEKIVAGSGVSVNGVAYWRSSMQMIVACDPAADGGGCRLVPWPMGYKEAWCQLGELDGRLCCVCVTDIRVEVHLLEPSDRWSLLRSFGIKKSLIWDEWDDDEEVEGPHWMDGCDGDQLVFLGKPRPLRFQTGRLEVLFLMGRQIVCLDVGSGRAREVCEVAMGLKDWICHEDYVAHINTFARVFPQLHGP